MKSTLRLTMIILDAMLIMLPSTVLGYTYNDHRWPKLSMPTFYVNQNGTPDCSNEFSAIQNALQTWTSVTTSYANFGYGGTTSNASAATYDGTNLMMWIESGWTNLFPSYPSAVAIAITWSISGVNYETDICFNGESYTWSDNGQSGRYDVQNIATHELGHTISLDDLYGEGDTEKTMYWSGPTGETKKRTLEPDDEDGLRYAYFDPTLSGTLSEDQKWVSSLDYGTTVSPTGNLTVPSGRTLTVASGLTVSPNGNYKLRTEGCLVANGATFTRSGGQWYGIELWGASSNTHISNCTIENASYGVYVYGTIYFYIDHCTIQNNSTGIASISGAHTISTNNITGNYYGVSCTNYSQVDFQLNNWVKFNSRGIYIDATSTPYLGTDQNRVYCSIWGNDWDVWSDYGGTVSAQWNYWGSYPANPMIYGTVDYSNELMVEPNPFLKIAVRNKPLQQTTADDSPGVASDTLGMAELDHARALEGKASAGEAQTALRSVITRYPNKTAGLIALVHLARLTERNATDPTRVLETYASEYGASPLGDFAKILMGQIKVRNRDTDGALALFEPLALAPGGLFEREALYNVGCLLWHRKDQKAEAEKYFRQLIEKWPDDPFAHSALATLGESPASKQVFPEKANDQEKPTAYDLSSAYPNPFNPTTTIGYQIPTDGYVKLVVFDLLGRQIAELASGLHTVGRYSSSWNASAVASGVYLARLTVTDELGQVKFCRINKLVLAK